MPEGRGSTRIRNSLTRMVRLARACCIVIPSVWLWEWGRGMPLSVTRQRARSARKKLTHKCVCQTACRPALPSHCPSLPARRARVTHEPLARSLALDPIAICTLGVAVEGKYRPPYTRSSRLLPSAMYFVLIAHMPHHSIRVASHFAAPRCTPNLTTKNLPTEFR